MASLLDITNIDTREYEGANYVYDLEALCASTFWLGSFGLEESCKSESYKMLDELPNAPFRIQGVVINGMTLNWQDISSLKKYSNVTGVTQGTTVNFKWLEDERRTVDWFHKLWFNAWYSREIQRFKTGVGGKFMHASIAPYHYVINSEGKLQAEVVTNLNFEFLAPTNLKPTSYDMTSEGDQVVEYTYKYQKLTDNPELSANFIKDAADKKFWSKASGKLLWI